MIWQTIVARDFHRAGEKKKRDDVCVSRIGGQCTSKEDSFFPLHRREQ